MSSFKVLSNRARHALCIRTLCLLILILFTATACSEKTVTEEGAAKLKAAIEQAIELRSANLDPQHKNLVLQRSGELTVTPIKDHYVVVLPHLSLKVGKNATLDLGVIKLNATPAGQNKYHVTTALPSEQISLEGVSTPRLELSTGKQEFRGLWHAKYDAFINMDAEYRDIRLSINSVDNSGVFTIGKVATKVNYQEEDDGKYTGPASFVLENIDFSAGAAGATDIKGVHGTIARIEAGGSVTKFDFDKYLELRKTMLTLNNRQSAEQEEPDEETELASMASLLDYLSNCANSGSSFLNVEKLDATFAAPLQTNGPGNLQLEKAGIGMAIADMNSNAASIVFNLDMNDLRIHPPPADIAHHLPFSLAINLVIENLPYQTLLDNVGNVIITAISEGDSTPAEEVDCNCATILSDAGTTLRFDGTHLSAGDIDADLGGAITMDITAAKKVVGDMNLIVRGVSQAIAALSQPDTPPEVMQQGMMVLGMLQAMGKPEVSEGGTNALIFKLQLNKNGQATLNGKPLPFHALGGAEKKPDDVQPTLP